ncbi:MAG: cell division protein FtsQ/DivIB [Proteobacteria bacterium]|nr:cell division protein FtsQ/DivIB [Pseudomonadota bacterium]
MREIVPRLAPDEVRPPPDPKSNAKPAPKIRPEAKPKAKPEVSSGTGKSPGPSKLSYRLSRAWAKPILRNGALVYLPLIALTIAGWRVAADDGWRGLIEARVVGLVEQIAARPEFAVSGVAVVGGGDELQAEVRRAVDIRPGMSSLKLDVEELRHRVEALGAVETATVQFDPRGTLRIAVVERIAVVLFRHTGGELVMLDKGGVEIGPAGPRASHPLLPVIRGPGAPDQVGEVIALLGGAPGIVPRLRALIRVGERRWDLELDRGLTIKLPASGAVAALSRIMALQYGEELLDRDIAVIDMRLPERPTLRMKPEAAETLQIRRAVAALGGEDT